MAKNVLPFYIRKSIHFDLGLHKDLIAAKFIASDFFLFSFFDGHTVVVSYSTHAHFSYIHQNMPFKKLFSWQILQQSHTCLGHSLRSSRKSVHD